MKRIVDPQVFEAGEDAIAEFRQEFTPMTIGKYGTVLDKKNKPTSDGIIFDSKLERNVYELLRDAHDRQQIKWVRLQTEFVLHAGIKYLADFLVCFPDDRLVVFEAKGRASEAWGIKRRLFKADYPQIELREINDLKEFRL
jgi:hypothetical protein